MRARPRGDATGYWRYLGMKFAQVGTSPGTYLTQISLLRGKRDRLKMAGLTGDGRGEKEKRGGWDECGVGWNDARLGG